MAPTTTPVVETAAATPTPQVGKEVWASAEFKHNGRVFKQYYRVARITNDAHGDLILAAIKTLDGGYEGKILNPSTQKALIDAFGEPGDFSAEVKEWRLPVAPKSAGGGRTSKEVTLVQHETLDMTGDHWRVFIGWPGAAMTWSRGTFTHDGLIEENKKRAEKGEEKVTTDARERAREHAEDTRKLILANGSKGMGDWFILIARNPRTSEVFAQHAAKGPIKAGSVVVCDPDAGEYKWAYLYEAPAPTPETNGSE